MSGTSAASATGWATRGPGDSGERSSIDLLQEKLCAQLNDQTQKVMDAEKAYNKAVLESGGVGSQEMYRTKEANRQALEVYAKLHAEFHRVLVWVLRSLQRSYDLIKDPMSRCFCSLFGSGLH